MKKALSKKNLWEGTPSALRSTLGRALAFAPLQWLLGRGFRSNHRFLAQAQWWSRDQARQYQLQKLREVLEIAWRNTRYYRNAFRSVGFGPEDLKSLDDFSSLPIIDKTTVIENLHDMRNQAIGERDIECGVTAGTSGMPLRFCMNADRSPTEYSYLIASWSRAGYQLASRMAVLRGRVVAPDRNGLRHEYDPLLRHHYYNNFHMADHDMARYLDHIATIGPCFLHVYPSTIAALARFIRSNHLKPPQNVQGIIAESEIVYPDQRRMVEALFGCRYFSCYGQSEKLVLACGCEHNDDYHVWPTYGYFELLDEDDRPVTTSGVEGQIVGTGFINTAMPFIRYRTGDYATYVDDHCPDCGRHHIRIRDIRGHRTQETLVTADGSQIPWAALNMHDDTFLHVRQFQFLQETPGRAVLKLVPGKSFDRAKDIERIRRNLGRKLDHQLTFTIETAETIPLTSRGKSIYVDQRIGPRSEMRTDTVEI